MTRASTRRRPPWVLLPLALGIVAIAFPWIGGTVYWTRQLYLVAILSLVVSGLNLSFGYAGELALGQAAMYAAGAYVGGYVAVHHTGDVLVCVVAGALGALAVGLLSGIPGLRLGGWSLAMVSFFLVLLIPDIILAFESQTGGFIGLIGIRPPTLLGSELTPRELYVVAVVLTMLWFAVFRNLVSSRHGASFLVLRQSPILASSLGTPVYRMKLAAYAIGAIPAGIAGTLFALLSRFVDPGSFTFDTAIIVLAASVLGGSTSVYGAVFGAALLQLGPIRTTALHDWQLPAYGAFLILTGVLLSQGVAGIVRPFVRRFAPSASMTTVPAYVDEAPDGSIGELPGAVLRVEGVSKRFGGFHALREVTLEARPGRITAIIGPNGSGKTTLLNVISGFYRPTAGKLLLGDDDLTNRTPHVIAGKGVARTFQTPIVPESLTAAEAVATGRYARAPLGMVASVLRLPAFWRTRAEDGAEAAAAMRLVGIADQAGSEAASLPLGTRRLVEVARVLCARPRLVLFDEVASGLDQGDLAGLAAIMRTMRDAGATVVLVEHNFGLVLDLADEIFVLANGEVFASGTPEEIAAHPGVLEQYLGVHSMSDEERRAVVDTIEGGQ